MNHEDMATIRSLKVKARARRQNQSQSEFQSQNQLQNQEKINPQQQQSQSIDSSLNSISNSDKAWMSYLVKNDSIINDIFGGQLQSLIECTTCRHKSYCFDPFLDLSVPVGFETLKCTVEDCLKTFSGIYI